jgi:hypothetical protein
MSNIGLLPNLNFVHVYFRAESATSLVISNGLSVYRNGIMVHSMNMAVTRSCPKNIDMLGSRLKSLRNKQSTQNF